MSPTSNKLPPQPPAQIDEPSLHDLQYKEQLIKTKLLEVELKNATNPNNRGIGDYVWESKGLRWVHAGPDIKAESSTIQAPPGYQSINESEILPGDIVEYGSNRWYVLERTTFHEVNGSQSARGQVQLQLINAPIHGTECVQLPLPGKPVILRKVED